MKFEILLSRLHRFCCMYSVHIFLPCCLPQQRSLQRNSTFHLFAAMHAGPIFFVCFVYALHFTFTSCWHVMFVSYLAIFNFFFYAKWSDSCFPIFNFPTQIRIYASSLLPLHHHLTAYYIHSINIFTFLLQPKT